MHRILVTDHPWPDLSLERELLADCELVEPPNAEEATLVRLAADCDAIAVCWAKVSGDVIRAAQQCRIVCRMGIGLDNIDVEAATERGIPVTNVPDYCVEEVADHALALLLACARSIGFFHLRTKRGEYDLTSAPPMRRLSGQTLGLLGLGRTARALASRAAPLGLTLLAHTPSGNDYGAGCRMVSFEQLLEQSDYISIHAPATDETHRLFDAAAFARMKSTAYLVNTSRGAIVDETALLAALQAGEIAGAALDVFDMEPPDLSRPLFQEERLIATPHAAFVSEESLVELRRRSMEQVQAALHGERPQNVVNPHIYDDPQQR